MVNNYICVASKFPMNSNNTKAYGNIRIPQPLIEGLKAWRQAFINVDNRPMTYGCMLSSMLEKQQESRPDVYNEVSKLLAKD